jgi:hypothetical protein
VSRDHDIIYPAKQRQNFDGGKNSKYEKHLILDNESPDALNVVFTNGAVETRPGVTKFNTASVGSFAGDGLYTRHDRTGVESMCAFWNGSLYVASGTTFNTIPSAQSVFTAGVRVGAAEQENYIFFGNGNVTPYKYNGAFTRHGVPAPTQTATAASFATGFVTGLYLYRYTNVNSALVESDGGPISVTFTAASATVQVSGIATAPASHGVNARRLYRTKNNSFATYFRVGEIANNTATTTTDNLIDGQLGAEMPRDAGEPPNYSIIINHQGRLFCNDTANPSFIWYSDIDANGSNPYVFPATNFFQVGDNSGDLIRGLAVHDNGLLIFTSNGAYIEYMPSPDDTEWVLVKLRSSYGSKSPFGLFSYNNKIMFPAIQNAKIVGFAAVAGNAVDPEATLLTVSAAGSDMKSDRIEPDVFDMSESFVGRISAMVFQNKAYITFANGSDATANNRMFVFDFSIENLTKKQEASWVPWTGLSAEQMTVYNGKLYYQSSAAVGFVHEMLKADQYNDDGAAINSYFWTKEFSGIPGDEQTYKDFRYTNLLYEKAGAYFMNLNYRTDSDLGDGNVLQVSLNPGGSLWGTMVWGRDNWGGGQAEGEQKLYFGQLRGKRLQLRFSNQNTVNQKFKIVSMQFGYNRKGRR